MGGIDSYSELANRTSQSPIRRGRHRYLSSAAIRNGGARRTRLRRERLHLLSQSAGARRLRGGRYRAKMGRSPQRAARLHFRSAGISRENAHGPGPRQYRRTRACRTAEPSASWRCNSDGFTRAAGCHTCTKSCSAWRESQSCAARWRVCTKRFQPGRWIAIAGNVSRFASAKGTGSPNAEGASRFAVPVSNRKCRSGCITKPDRSSDVAHGNDWRADVFRRLASCASLFAAQHQHRFKHAFLSFSL